MNFLKKLYKFSSSWTGTIIIVLLVIFFVAQAFVIPSGSMKSTLLIGDFLFVKKYSYGIPTPHLPWIEVPVLPDFKKNGHLIEGPRPQRGDIVIFRYPLEPKIHYVKRCVASQNDEIFYTDKNLYIHFSEGDDYIKENYPKEKIISINKKLWVQNPYQDKFPGIQYNKNENIFNQMTMFASTNRLAMRPAFVNELPSNPSGLPFNAFYFKVPQDEFFMMGDNRDHSNDSRFWGSVPYKLIVGKPWFIYFSWDENYILRWERIGRLSSTIETNKNYIHEEF